MRSDIGITLVLIVALCATTSSLAQEVTSEVHRAQELERGEHYQQAIQFYLGVLKQEPNNPEAYTGLGRTYFHSGQYPEAAGNFERALELQPGSPQIVEWSGKSYLRASEP
jgi:Flp pilus assembly protein TadD